MIASTAKNPSVLSPGKDVLLGDSIFHGSAEKVEAEYVELNSEPYICLRNVDGMAPFLISVVSNADHWLFVGSNSPFTAGRVEPDQALFPYQTADKILRSPDSSGALSILLVQQGDGWALWEPWRITGRSYKVTRNLYKHALGTSVIFEEINHDLGLRFSWNLTTTEAYGIVRKCTLEDLSGKPQSVRYLDGWHQLMPPGISQNIFDGYSYLAAAYMRHECQGTIGIYTLNSRITDRAEPSECLRVSCAWSLGHKKPVVLLSDTQVNDFRNGRQVRPESEVRGEFGAYLVSASVDLSPGQSHHWFTVADTGLDHRAVVSLQDKLMNPARLELALITEIDANAAGLRKRIGSADGLQQTADPAVSVHHFANVLFNCMRGGALIDSYHFPASDFAAFLRSRNVTVHDRHAAWLGKLPTRLDLHALQRQAGEQKDPQLKRLVREYMPLTFSRRHGDPSRPWNRFAIHVKDEQGNPIYGYQGNWRDIFQNWESLAQSYPALLESMIAVFLNASTADGYNPYRITRAGIDWEVLDPEDPWSQIGYWGDHQIIYLLRLLEQFDHSQPGNLSSQLNEKLYSYALVPYEIGNFEVLLRNPHQSITFNKALHKDLMARAAEIGNDGKLHSGKQGEVLLVTLAEKLLVPLLAKLSNLVPEGGIWLNTQRPEWNDANNALAGWGLSMVTVYYLRRYLTFVDRIFSESACDALEVSSAVALFLRQIAKILCESPSRKDAERFSFIAAMGAAGENHRHAVYSGNLGEQVQLPTAEVRTFIASALNVVETTIRANKRGDGMVHSYNLLNVRDQQASVQFLQLMLEGQVAAISSGALTPEEVVSLLKALRASALYRPDQNSYLLYPDREIRPFLCRNTLPSDWSARVPALAELVESGGGELIVVDQNGKAHFQGDLTNAADLNSKLDLLAQTPRWKDAVEQERNALVELWDAVFDHKSFTGRSGSMFAFEGLGSIYWHMIAKLLLAVQECHEHALASGADAQILEELAAAYYDVQHGLGFTKTPGVYGAFPSDPYSHSPRHRGAQQPGMTGQVKEEILTRFGELGVKVVKGCLCFAPQLLRREEFFATSHNFAYVDLAGTERVAKMPAGSLGFTYCQIPVCYCLGDAPSITIEQRYNGSETFPGNTLSKADSAHIFARTGEITQLTVTIPREKFRM